MKLYDGLKLAGNTPKKEEFRKQLSDMMLTALINNGYAEVAVYGANNTEYVQLTLQGAKALLDHEGLMQWKR